MRGVIVGSPSCRKKNCVIDGPLVTSASHSDFARSACLSSARGWIFLLLASVTLGGCVAVHWQDAHGDARHVGAIRYAVIDNDAAHILVIQSLGLDLRLGAFDPGVSFGYRKYIEVQQSRQSAVNEDGVFWIRYSSSNESGLFYRKTLGGELGFSLVSNGLMVGYERTTVVVGPSVGESVTTKIDFSEDNLPATRYSSKPGGQW